MHASVRHIGAAFGDYGGGSTVRTATPSLNCLPFRGRVCEYQLSACWAFSAASRSATVALFCMPSISATRLIVSASRGRSSSQPLRALRDQKPVRPRRPSFGRAIRARRTVTPTQPPQLNQGSLQASSIWRLRH